MPKRQKRTMLLCRDGTSLVPDRNPDGPIACHDGELYKFKCWFAGTDNTTYRVYVPTALVETVPA
jgi:hypothetical protein